MESSRTLDGDRPITYRVEIDGTPVTVDLMPDGTLHMEGRVFRLDVSEIQGLSLYSLLLDDASYEVVVDEKDGKYYALVRGKVHRIQVFNGAGPVTLKDRGAAPQGEVVVRAPLCGLVVEVSVSAGHPIEEGQVVLILESMKMENEIRAPRAGTVRDVRVQAGAVVRDGDVLLIVS